jgi:drug/metabolite transporter (DMT)-like permease
MNRTAVGWMLLATICFTAVNLIVKHLDYLPAHILVFFRSAVSLVISVFLLRIQRIPLLGNNRKWLVIRGVFGASALLLFFITIKGMPLATATTLQYLSPVFTVVFAMYIMKEQVRSRQWLFFAVSFAGVGIIMFANGQGLDGLTESVPWWMFGLSILSAVFSGIAYNGIMKCRNTDHPLVIVMYFPLIATPVMGVWSAISWVNPEPEDYVLLIIIGVMTQIAQFSMTKALTMERASKVTPFKYLGAIYAAVAGWLLFDEELGEYTFIGILLVIVGLVLNSVSRFSRKAA